MSVDFFFRLGAWNTGSTYPREDNEVVSLNKVCLFSLELVGTRLWSMVGSPF